MGEYNEPSQNELDIARGGIMIQLGTVTALKEFPSIEEGIDALGMREFVENQIRVIASERTYTQQLQNILHKRDGFNVG